MAEEISCNCYNKVFAKFLIQWGFKFMQKKLFCLRPGTKTLGPASCAGVVICPQCKLFDANNSYVWVWLYILHGINCTKVSHHSRDETLDIFMEFVTKKCFFVWVNKGNVLVCYKNAHFIFQYLRLKMLWGTLTDKVQLC